MMKLVNRLLVIAVIAFGSWFLVQQWDKVDNRAVLDTEVTDVTELADGAIITDTEDLEINDVNNIDPADKPERKIQPPMTNNDTMIKKSYQPETKGSTSTEVSTKPVAEVSPAEITTEITIYLFDGGFDISKSVITEGTVIFNVRNDGVMPHEFAVEGIKDFGRVSPKESKVFTLNLGEGEYELFSPRVVDQTLTCARL